jgi:hypothetical protein
MKINSFFFSIACVILTQCTISMTAMAQNTDNYQIPKLSFDETQKQVNIVYVEDKLTIANKEIFLAYYDEATLKKIIKSAITDVNGVVSFLIPSSENGASVPFYFAFKETDFAKHKFALRIPSTTTYNKGGEDTVTLTVDKKFYFKFHDPIQLINFPQEGAKSGNGGDVITGGGLSLR